MLSTWQDSAIYGDLIVPYILGRGFRRFVASTPNLSCFFLLILGSHIISQKTIRITAYYFLIHRLSIFIAY